jgi:serine/threonine-protein kinase
MPTREFARWQRSLSVKLNRKKAQTLSSLRTKLSLKELLSIVGQVAEALAAAHQSGVVHRDIKPDNVMVRPDGWVKVLDFGLVKMVEISSPTVDAANTELGVAMGTLSYMSPEQAAGEPIDHRTDIWSLGVVVYEMITGKRPFRGDTTSDVIAAILRSEPEPISSEHSDTFDVLEPIVVKALKKDRDQRYPSMKEMLADLKELRRDLDTQMRSDTASFGATRIDRPALSTGNGNVTVESTASRAAYRLVATTAARYSPT